MIIVKTIEAILEHIRKLLPDVQCEFSYLPVASAEEMERLGKPIVYVFPHDCTIENVTQGGSRKYTIEVHISFNKKLRVESDNIVSEINELIGYEELIYNEFLKKVTIVKDNFRIIADQPQFEILSDVETIDQHNCFFGFISILVNIYGVPSVLNIP